MGDSTEHSYTFASAHDDSSAIHHPRFDTFTEAEAETSTESSPDMPSPAYLQNNKTLRDLSGKWVMSKSLSVGIPKALEIQGYPSATRKALLTSPIYLTITQSHYPSQLLIRTEILRRPRSNYSSPSHSPSRAVLQQQVTNSLVPPSTTERWYPPQKVGQWSEWTNGVVEVPVAEKEKSWNMNSQTSDRRVLATRGRCRWVRGSDFEHKEGIGYLTEGLARSDEFFETEVECPEAGWRNVQVWFMDRGRLVKRVVTFDVRETEGRFADEVRSVESPPGRRAETRWVYEFQGR